MFTCVLKSGGIYTPEHVKRLQGQLGTKLRCLTDIPINDPNVIEVPLRYDLPGWWSKMELFRLPPPCIYFDLDVSIVGNPHALRTMSFTMWEDPMYPDGYNSSVMSWVLPPVGLWDNYIIQGMPHHNNGRWPYVGDQGFISTFAPYIEKFDKGLVKSYRCEVAKEGLDDNTVVVAYHGRPKPWELE